MSPVAADWLEQAIAELEQAKLDPADAAEAAEALEAIIALRDQAELGIAWTQAQAALPDGWDLMVGHTSECQYCEGWWATASKRLAEPPHYPRVVSSEHGRPRGEHHDATPAAALRALAVRLLERAG